MLMVAVAVTVLVLAAGFVLLFWKLGARSDTRPVDAAWLEGFSVATYAPMERLLDRTDFTFLEAQPGYDSRVAKALLTQRRRIFNGYLRLLTRDFNRLHTFARWLLVYSPSDRPAFAKDLWRQYAAFYWTVFGLRCKVAFYPLGWTALDVPRLCRSLDQMGSELKEALQRAHSVPA